jgi:DNA-binding IscR family transcriptional regulator
MKFDARLSGALHVLLHMSTFEGPVTSAQLAGAMHTNPVVIRRMMANMRRAGYVRSERGHGGGWEIACDLDRTTLLDIYRAIGSPVLIGLLGSDTNPSCLVERAVESTLGESRREAEELLLRRFSEVSLQSLSDQFRLASIEPNASCLEMNNAL